MSAFNYENTAPTGRQLEQKGAIGRRTEIRSHKVDPDPWDERRDRSVVLGQIWGGVKVLSPRAEYDAEGVRVA